MPKLSLRRRRDTERSRGQALVEFALILPILALMMMLALDFGRVFFGWVGLSNAVRIAANAAAAHPDAWNGSGNPSAATWQDQYRHQTANDLSAINCDPVGHSGAWSATDVPTPTFGNADPADTSSPYENGDFASVSLTCSFHFLTPLVGNILGNPLSISSSAHFAVRGAEINGIPLTGGGCSGASVPNLVGASVADARLLWTGAGFIAGTFNPATGSDTDVVTAQVTAPVSAPGDCVAVNTSVTVTHLPAGSNCTMPLLVGKNVSTAGGLYTSAGFTGTFSVNTPPNGDYKIKSQSLVAGQGYGCASDVTVGGN